jgi:hypothetical protein
MKSSASYTQGVAVSAVPDADGMGITVTGVSVGNANVTAHCHGETDFDAVAAVNVVAASQSWATSATLDPD